MTAQALQQSRTDRDAGSTDLALRRLFDAFERRILGRQPRGGRGWAAVASTVLLVCALLAVLWRARPQPLSAGEAQLIPFLSLCGFRWLLKVVHFVRAWTYRTVVYPRLCKARQRVAIDRVFVIVPTFHEQAWITRLVLSRIVAELGGLPQPAVLFVCAGAESDRQVVDDWRRSGRLPRCVDFIVRSQQSKGKRGALAESLRYLVDHYPCGKGLVVLMDGDSVWCPGLWPRVVSLFESHLGLGAVTTNEEAFCPSSGPYGRWFSLRMALRDFYMSSHALSRRLLCLTGRFSVLRSEAAFNPDFIRIMADDGIDHWLYGRIRFLGGDDKSSWFWLYTRGEALGFADFLYLPDVTVITIESVTTRPLARVLQNLQRWFTNTARNNGRSLAVLPIVQTPAFIWLALLMQRCAVYLNVLSVALLGIIALGDDQRALVTALWVAGSSGMFTYLSLTALGKRGGLEWLVWLLFERWVGSFVKLRCLSSLGEQKWLHRGGQVSAARGGSWLVRGTVVLQFSASVGVLFVLAVWLSQGCPVHFWTFPPWPVP